ncbi:MAG: dTDP-glucose 4,6-dehydratase [Rhodobacteraceae bacterium]|nr:dTDP-glucose 4,6-dehydratase [Paracoccaceae bacterium]
MRLLVTGGAGFIGSAVVRQAVACGHRVVTLDALGHAGNLSNLAAVADNPAHVFERADIRDGTAVAALLSRHRPDAILHLAAETHVDRSIDGPLDFVSTNVGGTATLLEAVRSYWEGEGRPAHFRFLHVSTDEVFGSLGPEGRFSETSPYAPRSPYAASKAAADHLVRAWGETWGLPVLITNCSNNYGPFHFPEKLVPLTVLAALEGREVPVYGTGTNRRDWLFVEDHAEALLLVLGRGNPGGSWCIGAEEERANIDLVREICRILDRLRPGRGPHARLIRMVPDRPGHDMRYSIDPGRMWRDFGWRARVPLSEGLERTVRWYLDNRGWWEPLRSCAGLGRRLGLGRGPAAASPPALRAGGMR